MQLILETENSSLSVEGKMSAVERDAPNEKLVLNGDKSVTGVNGKIELGSNGGSDQQIILSITKDVLVEKESEVNNEVISEHALNKPSVEDVEMTEIDKPDETKSVTPSVELPAIDNSPTSPLASTDPQTTTEDLISPKEAKKLTADTALSVSDTHQDESQNDIAQENKKNTEKSRAMELDEHVDISLEKLESGDFKKDVTNSITAIVNDIVKDLNDDIAEDNIENDAVNSECELINTEIRNKCEDTSSQKEIAEASIQFEGVTTEIDKKTTNLIDDASVVPVSLEDTEKVEDKESNNIGDTEIPLCNVNNDNAGHESDKNTDTVSELDLLKMDTEDAEVAAEVKTEIKINELEMETDNIESIETATSDSSNESKVIEKVSSNKTEELADSVMDTDDISTKEDISDDEKEILQGKPTEKDTSVVEHKDLSEKQVHTVEAKPTSSDETKVTEKSITESKGKDDTSDVEEVNDVETESKPQDEEDKTPQKDTVSVVTVDSKDDLSDVEEVKITESEPKPQIEHETTKNNLEKETLDKEIELRNSAPLIKLSNNLDILSDDDDEPVSKEVKTVVNNSADKQCINLDDDDDIMLIEEDSKDVQPGTSNDNTVGKSENKDKLHENEPKVPDSEVIESSEKDKLPAPTEKDSSDLESKEATSTKPLETENIPEEAIPEKPKPLVPTDFFKTYRKNLADMTRDDLEEFCILKIVESIIDRSSLNEIRTKLKTMAQNIEEYKKKALMLSKQNRDLQVVLKSVQEEQKKMTDQPIAPLRITRSVGMQVLMTEKGRRKPQVPISPNTNAMNTIPINTTPVHTTTRPIRNTPPTRPVRPNASQTIPVPRLVPAVNASSKPANMSPQQNTQKSSPSVQNGTKLSPAQKNAEKRTRAQMQPPAQPQPQSQSVTVDLTDDEPPSKLAARNSTAVRLVNTQNLLSSGKQQAATTSNSPRKVFIPISGPQGHNIRPGQTIMLKSVPNPSIKPRGPTPPMARAPQSALQVRRLQGLRHPAPLPESMKQYQPPNWKALPPAPDLKLSKVENGIVISWKIEDYQEDSYENIASYQLYAYQETSAPPNTTLWKKIGDVKALPLPMACTLTQFMAGYKYYFAVRAVDIRSRLGPFSLPGSILLLNKM